MGRVSQEEMAAAGQGETGSQETAHRFRHVECRTNDAGTRAWRVFATQGSQHDGHALADRSGQLLFSVYSENVLVFQ